MTPNNLDVDIVDFLDLIDHTLSYSFIEKWRYKYSERFIKHAQLKILDSMNKQRPIKVEVLYNYLVKKCKYDPSQVLNFFESIEIELYRPFIYGDLPSA